MYVKLLIYFYIARNDLQEATVLLAASFEETFSRLLGCELIAKVEIYAFFLCFAGEQ